MYMDQRESRLQKLRDLPSTRMPIGESVRFNSFILKAHGPCVQLHRNAVDAYLRRSAFGLRSGV